jgi:serine/threonine protein kinase
MPSSVQIPLPSRYRLGAHIANGGMAAVWAADDELLARPVAIKVLAAHLAEEPVNAQRFQREARAAARLSSHPNVVTVFDVGEHEGRSFMVMERLEGGSVADRLRQGRPPRAQALGWLKETAAALDFAHEHGIVHRDVKPANLLLDDLGHVRVADFGIARIATEDTMTTTGQLLGTAAYLSPEVVEGDPATAASDTYGLAVVAFELLTGERPFSGDHPAAQARQHVEEPPPRASDRDPSLPTRVDVALQRGMAKDPEARWPTAGAFVAALEAALPREGARTVRTVAAPPRRRGDDAPAAGAGEPHGRRTGALVALGVLAVIAAVVAIVLGSSGGGSGGSADRAGGTPAATQKKHKRPPKTRSTPPSSPATSTPAPSTGSSSSDTTSTPSTGGGSTTSGSGSTPSGGSSDAASLQAQGHALIEQGQYDQAVGVLRQAIAATGKSTAECINPTGACLTYAYSLYDLGHALRLAGQTDEAIAVLQDRLRIRNQTSTVQAELDAARSGSTGSTPAPATPAGKVPPGQAKKQKPGSGD